MENGQNSENSRSAPTETVPGPSFHLLMFFSPLLSIFLSLSKISSPISTFLPVSRHNLCGSRIVLEAKDRSRAKASHPQERERERATTAPFSPLLYYFSSPFSSVLSPSPPFFLRHFTFYYWLIWRVGTGRGEGTKSYQLGVAHRLASSYFKVTTHVATPIFGFYLSKFARLLILFLEKI